MKKPRKGTTLADLIADVKANLGPPPPVNLSSRPNFAPTIPGAKHFWTFPDGESPVAMVTWQGHILVATNVRVYVIRDFVLVPLSITNAD